MQPKILYIFFLRYLDLELWLGLGLDLLLGVVFSYIFRKIAQYFLILMVTIRRIRGRGTAARITCDFDTARRVNSNGQ